MDRVQRAAIELAAAVLEAMLDEDDRQAIPEETAYADYRDLPRPEESDAIWGETEDTHEHRLADS